MPPIKKSLGMGTLTMKDSMAYGFSKFRITSVAVDVNQLTVSEKKLIYLFTKRFISKYVMIIQNIFPNR